MILGDLLFFREFKTKRKPGKHTEAGYINLSHLSLVQCFHVTQIHRRESILTYGLIPVGRPGGSVFSYEPRVFLSTIYDDLPFDYVGPECLDVWTFYLPPAKLYIDEHEVSYKNHYYVTEMIPWYKLVLLETRY